MKDSSTKVMFEIYREASYGRKFRAVYFTELDENNKEMEISRAMAGDHVYDGFLSETTLNEAKAAVQEIVQRLNEGEVMDAIQLDALLAPYQTDA